MKLSLVTAAAAASIAASAAPAVAGDAAKGAPVSVPAPPAGKGQIVFYRPGGTGMAMGCTVREGETKISSVGNGKYVVAEPGKHDYAVRSEAKDSLTLLVEPDETQFVRCKIKMGIMAGRPDIFPSSADDFAKVSPKLKMVHDDDMGQGALRSTDLAKKS
ncbi:MAG TPA: hypothetical protein VIC34_09100 [Croceibacterium sp.]|jgi:hypothetical protein